MSSLIYAFGVSKTYPTIEEKYCGGGKKVFFRGIAPGIETALTVADPIFVKVEKWNRDSVDELEITCKCETCGAKAFEILEFKYADNNNEIWSKEVVADWCSYCETRRLTEDHSDFEYYTPCPSPPAPIPQAERSCDIQ